MEEKNKTNKLFVIVLVGALLLIVVVFSLFVLKPKKVEENANSSPNTRTSEIILEEGQTIEKTDAGYFTIQMQLEAFSEDGLNFKGEIANALENQHSVYAVIKLADTGEEIFKSDLLPIGNKIDEFTINKKLENGKYNTVLSFVSVEEDGKTEISEVNVEYILNVSK